MPANLTVRVLILFAAVGVMALIMPINPESAHSQSVIRDNSWGDLPLKVTLKAGQ